MNELQNLDFRDSRFQSFLRLIPAAVAVLDKEMCYLAASNRWYTDYGLSDTSVLGRSHYDVFPEILGMQHWLDIHQDCLKGNIRENEEDPFPRADGKIDWVRWKVYPWYDSDGGIGGMIMYTEVITKRKESELSLRELNRKLSHSFQELSQRHKQLEDFAYITSHNLRSPASNLVALTRLYAAAPEDFDAATVLTQISSSAESLIQTLDDLYQVLMIRTNTMIPKDFLSFAEVFAQAKDKVQVLFQKVDARIEVDFKESPMISYPKTYLENIFMSLLSNAFKFRSAERLLHLKVGTYIQNDTTYLYFTDNGLGIDLERHGDKLFKMGKVFHRQQGGRGVGLFILKNYVEALGGSVTVESEVNQGTTFTICF